jgi:putative transposase
MQPSSQRRTYATDVSDEEWKLLAPFFPGQSGPGRPRTLDLRSVLNALFYLNRTGCQWRPLPRDFPNPHTAFATTWGHNIFHPHFPR